jgi:hypothetical protein
MSNYGIKYIIIINSHKCQFRLHHCDGLVEMIKMDILFSCIGVAMQKIFKRQLLQSPMRRHVAASHWPLASAHRSLGAREPLPGRVAAACWLPAPHAGARAGVGQAPGRDKWRRGVGWVNVGCMGQLVRLVFLFPVPFQ